MTKTLPFISLLLVSLCSCAWLKSNSTALSADSLQVVSCVVSAAQSGQLVEEISCGAMAVSDVVAILDAAHVQPAPSPALTQVRAMQRRVVLTPQVQ